MRSGFEVHIESHCKNESPTKAGKDHEAKKQMNLQERVTYSRIEAEKKIILDAIEILINTVDVMLSQLHICKSFKFDKHNAKTITIYYGNSKGVASEY
jgi:hypothetical protein